MEIHVYDRNLKRLGHIENHTSLQWHRKYYECGTFELHCPVTAENLRLLKPGNIITKGDKKEAAVIRGDQTEEESTLVNEITRNGYFLPVYLGDRLTGPLFNFNGTVEDAMHFMLNRMEKIPLLQIGADTGDKTKVIVGGAGDGANRIYVTVGGGTGFDLREVFLDAKDINKDQLTDAQYLEALKTRGQEYLNENKVLENFEAEAEADVNFIYGKDYDLGDVVTVKKKKWNTAQNLRITELCEVYEYGGMYVVPTFGDALPTTIKWDE